MTADLEVRELGAPLFEGAARWSDLVAAVGVPAPAVVLTTFDAGSGTAWHVHEFPQVLVVSGGSGALELPGAVRALVAGDVAVVPAGVPHRHAAGGDGMTHVSVCAPDDTRLADPPA